MEIGLPDEHGRIQIFNIHTTSMRSNNYLDPTVRVEELAAQTKNFSGAEIEGKFFEFLSEIHFLFRSCKERGIFCHE
jgi:vesicle-fusing ATPase